MKPMISSDLANDARRYLTERLLGVDMSDLPIDSTVSMVEQLYPGGWAAYRDNYMRFMRDTQREVTEKLSPIKQKALVQHMIGRKLRMYDEIISADFGDTETKIVLRIAQVDYRSRRDVVTGATIQLHVFQRPTPDAKWSHQCIEVDDEVDLQHVRFGAVNTPERDEAIKEQVETCYRPGTHKSPMKGWVARAELSWDQAHADEAFQKPNTHTA